MPPPTTSDQFLSLVQSSGVVEAERLPAELERLRAAGPLPAAPKEVADLLVREGLLTTFQAEQLLRGRWRGFTLGKYLILERLGAGGMGVVYLAEHKLLRRQVAIKVLPPSLAEDPWFLEHFYKEAQAVAALHHPNIVCAHDIDRADKLHFLVMEYVEGSSLEDIVRKHGPMDPVRVAHYVRQAALGLQCAHQAGLVHRDIKPSNLLLDRQGVVKILDLGLACVARDRTPEASRDKKAARVIVGTDDYLAPEQIVDSDDVDARADIYSLGATGYYLLTGRAPFQDVTLDHHKLIWHLLRNPKPIRELRAEVPGELAAVFSCMMAKNPWERPQSPAAVAEALVPWTRTPIPPPPAAEMPGLSWLARRPGAPEAKPASSHRGKSSWVVYNAAEPRSALLPASSAQTSPSSPTSPAADTAKETRFSSPAEDGKTASFPGERGAPAS